MDGGAGEEKRGADLLAAVEAGNVARVKQLFSSSSPSSSSPSFNAEVIVLKALELLVQFQRKVQRQRRKAEELTEKVDVHRAIFRYCVETMGDERVYNKCLHACCMSLQVEEAEWLLERHADANSVISDDDSQTTPLIHTVSCRVHWREKERIIDMIDLLLRNSADVMQQNKNDSSPLLRAITAKQDARVMQLLLTANSECLLQKDRRGQTGLHKMAQSGVPEDVLSMALHSISDDAARIKLVNDSDCSQRTALHLASLNMHAHVVRQLLHAGANSNAVDAEGNTPLHLAVAQGALGRPSMHPADGSVAVIEALLQDGADLLCRNSAGQIPLHRCTTEPAVQALCSQRSSQQLVSVDSKGSLPVLEAAKRGDMLVVRRLLMMAKSQGLDLREKGYRLAAVMNSDGDTLLHRTAESHALCEAVEEESETSFSLIKELIETFCADVNAIGGEGQTPLHRAAAEGVMEAVNALLHPALPTDLSIKDSKGFSPCRVALNSFAVYPLCEMISFCASQEHKDVADLGEAEKWDNVLESCGVTLQEILEKRNADGLSLLHQAARVNYVDGVRLLLSMGFSPVTPAQFAGDRFIDGGTPFHMAVRGDNEAVLEELLRAVCSSSAPSYSPVDCLGFDAVDPTNQQTPFHVACDLGSHRCLETMLSFPYCGANWNSRGKEEEAKNTVTARLLQTIALKDDMGDTAMNLAQSSGASRCIQLLKEFLSSAQRMGS